MPTALKSKSFWISVAAWLGALVSLGAFLDAALKDHSATAATAAALCLSLCVIASFDLESFEALGIKAKLRSTLSEAEQRLQDIEKRLRHVDSLIKTLASSTYLQAARGTLAPNERRQIVSELNRNLSDAGISQSEIEDLRAVYMASVASSLWSISEWNWQVLSSDWANAAHTRLITLPDGDERREAERVYNLLQQNTYGAGPNAINYRDFSTLLERRINSLELPSRGIRQALLEDADRYNRAFQKCLDTGFGTEEIEKIVSDFHNDREVAIADLRKRIKIYDA